MVGKQGFGKVCDRHLPRGEVSALAFSNRVEAQLEHGYFTIVCKRSTNFKLSAHMIAEIGKDVQPLRAFCPAIGQTRQKLFRIRIKG
jgi:hypothetical protein